MPKAPGPRGPKSPMRRSLRKPGPSSMRGCRSSGAGTVSSRSETATDRLRSTATPVTAPPTVDLAQALFGLAVQASVLDGQRGLLAERGRQVDFLGGKGSRFGVEEGDGAEGPTAGDERGCDHRTEILHQAAHA